MTVKLRCDFCPQPLPPILYLEPAAVDNFFSSELGFRLWIMLGDRSNTGIVTEHLRGTKPQARERKLVLHCKQLVWGWAVGFRQKIHTVFRGFLSRKCAISVPFHGYYSEWRHQLSVLPHSDDQVKVAVPSDGRSPLMAETQQQAMANSLLSWYYS